jgi:hypothetical protein
MSNFVVDVLEFLVNGFTVTFQLQDKADRVEDLGEVFNKWTITPPVPNGEFFRFRFNEMPYQAQRQGQRGMFDELLSPTFNKLLFPYHPEDPRNIGTWGWMDGSLLSTKGNASSTDIKNVVVHKGAKPINMNITNPYTRNTDNKQKEYTVLSDFVQITKITARLYQAMNDFTKDKNTGLPNASIKLYYRQQLAAGGVFEFYPIVKPRTIDGQPAGVKNRLQLEAQDIYLNLLRIHEGEEVAQVAKEFYTKKSLRGQEYRKAEAGIATGEISEETVSAVDTASKQYAMGEAVEEFKRTVKINGESIDVSAVPLALYSATIDGHKDYFDTRVRSGRYNLDAAAQRLNGSLDLTPEPDNFTFA